jgi:hypothetical protein
MLAVVEWGRGATIGIPVFNRSENEVVEEAANLSCYKSGNVFEGDSVSGVHVLFAHQAQLSRPVLQYSTKLLSHSSLMERK